MPMTAQDYFDKEVLKTQRAAKAAIKEIVDMPANKVKQAGLLMNDTLFKSRLPIFHSHMKKALEGGGKIKHNTKSKAASAILASPEFKAIVKKQADTCFQNPVFFKKNLDLAAAIYNATVYGEVTCEGKKYKVTATVEDTFDYRWDLIPKDKSIKGCAFRTAGNIMYLLQEMKLVKSVKITVEVDGYVK